MASGPLAGIKIVEFAGLGPTPFAAMTLADMGADIIRIDRPVSNRAYAGDPRREVLNRGRRSIVLDLKAPESCEMARGLSARADVVLEGFRPGVMERLGLGPDDLHELNPALIYARMTGWGQTGAMAQRAGHDINYIAMAGALHTIGDPALPPPPPLNLLGDFGGGAMYVVSGILAALIERSRSGRGQIIDAAMADGLAMLTTQIQAWRLTGFWADERGSNLLDGSSYFYRCYETADRRFLAVGAVEPQFHRAFLEGLGFDPAQFADQLDRALWPERTERIAAVIAKRTRDEWADIFAGVDACVSPVLTLAEAADHPASRSRAVFGTVDGFEQPMPAPRFSRTPGEVRHRPHVPDEDGAAIRAALAAGPAWPQ
jgi:alpha-methylacyl-CoA racemase